MQRPIAAVPLSCLALLSACLWLAGGCANQTPTSQLLQTGTTQGTTNGTTSQGTTSTCTGTCTPYIYLAPWSIGLKPGASATFSSTVYNYNPADHTYNLDDHTVTWSIKEGSAGGTITDTGVYTAPLTEGIYHVTATSKANSTLSQTATIVVTASEFTVSGSKSTLRWGHTASLLPSGQVFIAGGEDDDYGFADPAELYDPATGTFHSAGQVARIQHTATVLANGDVLLAGGYGVLAGNYGPMGTADLLKAGTGVIQPTGSMNTPRSGHTATLLKDGRVLIAGGYNYSNPGGKPTQTTEIYDPASGRFSPAGDMTTPRSGHSAALLPNGRVLIVGGGAAGAELYDPATNSFLLVPGVSASRCWVSATQLADGRVLIAGGTDCSIPSTVLDTAEIYDPSTGQSTPTGKLVAAQASHTATLLLDGRVLLVGGTPQNLGQFYDPVTGSFTFGPHLINPRYGHTATLLPDGSLLIAGGSESGSTELYK